MLKIIVTFAITGETAESYADVCPELIFEDFVSRHNGECVELIETNITGGDTPCS